MAVPNINKLIIKVIINKKKKLNFLYLKNAKHELNVFFGYRKRSKRESKNFEKSGKYLKYFCSNVELKNFYIATFQVNRYLLLYFY